MLEINETIPFEGEFVEVPCDEQGIVPAENAGEGSVMVVDYDDEEDDCSQFTAGDALAIVAIAAGGYGVGKLAEFAYRKWLAPFGDKLAEKWMNKRSSEKEEDSETAPKLEGVKEDIAAAEQLAKDFVEQQNREKMTVKTVKKHRK